MKKTASTKSLHYVLILFLCSQTRGGGGSLLFFFFVSPVANEHLRI